MTKSNHDDEKKVWLDDKQKGVRFFGEEKGGACDKKLEEDRSFHFFFFFFVEHVLVGIASRRSGVARRWKRHRSNSDDSNAVGSNGIATAVARGSW